MLVNAPDSVIQKPDWTVHAMTAGAPPPAAILEKIEKLGFNVTQVYGLTETYGHLTHCAWHEEWDGLDFGERATISSSGGPLCPYRSFELDQETGKPVPADGQTLGEVCFRSNCIMKGYHENPEATEEARQGCSNRRFGSAPSKWLYRDKGQAERYHHFRRREYIIGRDEVFYIVFLGSPLPLLWPSR